MCETESCQIEYLAGIVTKRELIHISILSHIKNLTTMGISYLQRRDENIYVFGSWYGEKFADNPKYLFLYYLKQGRNAYWVTKNADVYNTLKAQNIPVLMFDSEEGKRISRRAKFIFYCCSRYDVNRCYAAGAVMINLWHGVPLKKIMYDDTVSYNTGRQSFYERMTDRIENFLFSKNYVVSTSRVITEIYKSAFRAEESHIFNLGQPRNDCFFDASIDRVKYANIQYDTLITYMPTMRNMGKTKIDLDRLLDLDKLDDFCKRNNALFLVKKHFCHREERTDLTRYTNIIDMTAAVVDTQELLYNTDILITDYSSCYIDYLLLGKPIIFYAYDLVDYLKEDREMYFSYRDVTPGPVVNRFPDLYGAMEALMNCEFEVDEQYKNVRNLFYDPNNQKEVSQNIMKALDGIT